MKVSLSEDDFRAAIAKEESDSRRAGCAFAKACAASDVRAMLGAVERIGETVNGWLFAMRAVGRLEHVPPAIREAFLPIWIEHKMLPLMVGERKTMALALRRLMPSSYAGEPLMLYRGASFAERQRRLYGFSWTTQLDIARRFSEHWARDDREGVILTTEAPADAVLLVREDPAYYDESEVVVDPYRLSRVMVAERLRAPTD